MTNEIRIELDGPHGGIDPRAVADTILAVEKILRHISGVNPAELNLTELKIGSAVIAVRVDQARAEAFHDGVDFLANGDGIPRCWSAEAVAGLIDLERVATRRGVKAIRLRIGKSIHMIDGAIAQHAKNSIMPLPVSLGSVRGTLYRYNNSPSKRSAGIKDYRTGASVEVTFPHRLQSDIRAALDYEVEIWGRVHRDADDQVTTVNAEGIEVIESSRAAVTLDDVAGILGTTWTDGLDAVEWVRRQRD
ncbi:hypothetical protein [Actinokineospora xionganensis]|uniref:Uncharacterized protein n=1 Tax=Actinokineospora xionganensis TaxID=2684470 RepID=A0ABR7L380_9PSEU|nr:hypothetical protein [Actinokineospora xionganensis]MBC6446963.1 hypothetical protein [Actinokineospora xionganensis]